MTPVRGRYIGAFVVSENTEDVVTNSRIIDSVKTPFGKG